MSDMMNIISMVSMVKPHQTMNVSIILLALIAISLKTYILTLRLH